MHGVRANPPRCSSDVPGRSCALGIVEEETCPEISAAAYPSNPVTLVGEEMLEEDLELPAAHGVDGGHSGTLIGLALLSATAAECRQSSSDERHRTQEIKAMPTPASVAPKTSRTAPATASVTEGCRLNNGTTARRAAGLRLRSAEAALARVDRTFLTVAMTRGGIRLSAIRD